MLCLSYSTFYAFLLLQQLQIRPEEVLIESTGVIGQRIKKVYIHCMFSRYDGILHVLGYALIIFGYCLYTGSTSEFTSKTS